MRQRILGKIVERSTAPLESAGWQWRGPYWSLALEGQTPGSHVHVWDSLMLVIRGIARLRGSRETLDHDLLAEEIRAAYLETGELPVERLEGAYNLVLLDGATERGRLYRNFAGSGELFYCDRAPGLLFASNLAELAAVLEAPEIDRSGLPSVLLRGSVPGRNTLLAGCQRLMPGEMLSWEAGRIQRRRLASGPTLARGDRDEVLARVLADAQVQHGRLATLLDAGVSSQRLQAGYNDLARNELLPTTFSPALDNESAWADTDAIMLASRQLGTEHRLIPVEKSLPAALTAAIAATGEPNLGSSAFVLGLLAPAVQRYGFGAALTSLGACEPVAPEPTWRRALATVGHWFGLGSRSNSELAVDPEWFADSIDPVDFEAAQSWQDDPLALALDEAGRAITLFNVHGVDLLCPYLDSRILALGSEGQRLLGNAGPVADWVATAGPLRGLVERLHLPGLVSETTRRRLWQRPGPLLGHLLGYDLFTRWIGETGRRVLPVPAPDRLPQAA